MQCGGTCLPGRAGGTHLLLLAQHLDKRQRQRGHVAREEGKRVAVGRQPPGSAAPACYSISGGVEGFGTQGFDTEGFGTEGFGMEGAQR